MADDYVQNPAWKNEISISSAKSKERGDLALIHFAGGLPEGASLVTLADSKLKLEAGDQVLVMGYGVSNAAKRSGGGVLRQAQTTVLGVTSKTEIATDGKMSSVCFGDSGGPAFVESGDGWIQWGVASAVSNESCNEASVHTDLRSYRAWIKKAMDGMRGKANHTSEDFVESIR
jgi:secreted trypsin-like serine protease